MEITEVRIKLMDDPNDRLQGFCSITFDGCFVIRDLKIIQGAKGAFVAMPSRKLTDRCGDCGAKNHLRAAYCNECGGELEPDRAVKDGDGRAKLYADIAHPINSRCRDMIQTRVLDAFENEKILAKKPGYVCTYDDYGEDRIATVKRRPGSTATESASSDSSPSGRTIRIDGPDGQQRRIDIPGGETASRPHHLDTPDRAREAAGDADESFGVGV
ncbi:stage V sporulation protein G [bacterium]|nr:stage V sporulation protein G [bacterium]